jgi:hypothetical protein
MPGLPGDVPSGFDTVCPFMNGIHCRKLRLTGSKDFKDFSSCNNLALVLYLRYFKAINYEI